MTAYHIGVVLIAAMLGLSGHIIITEVGSNWVRILRTMRGDFVRTGPSPAAPDRAPRGMEVRHGR